MWGTTGDRDVPLWPILGSPLLHWTTAAFDDTMNLPSKSDRYPTARSSLPSAAWWRRRCPDRRP